MNDKFYVRLDNVSKLFGEGSNLIDKFSYDFVQDNVYLLSGRNRNVLLDILVGNQCFDGGTIDFYAFRFHRQISALVRRNSISYLSSDYNFISYLSVRDNLELCLRNVSDKKMIARYLSDFKLDGILNKFPNQLSDSEMQRVVLIQALLLGHKIIVLDEPTLSLNKMEIDILKMVLKMISRDHIIIVASDDNSMIDVADFIIDLDNFKSEVLLKRKRLLEKSGSLTKDISILFKYIFKRLAYERRFRKLDVVLGFILISIFLLLLLFGNYFGLWITLLFGASIIFDYFGSVFERRVFDSIYYSYGYSMFIITFSNILFSILLTFIKFIVAGFISLLLLLFLSLLLSL